MSHAVPSVRLTTRRHARNTGSATSTILIVLVLFAAAVAAYLAANASSGVQGVDHDRAVRSLGLGNPVVNKLADTYVDTDADLIADAPEATRSPETLRFSYLSEAAGVTADQLERLRQHLAEATGLPVQYVAIADDDSQLRALAAGELDVTGFNTGNVPVAVNVAGFVPVAAPAKAGQRAAYRMVILTPADSELQTPADIAGQTLALTRPGSNSGYKAPLVLLKEQFKLLPSRDYIWSFSQSHANSIAGIKEGTISAAATASDLLDEAVASEQIATGDYRVIFESAAFPVAALGVAHDLDAQLAGKLKAALLAFNPSDADAASTALAGADAMVPVNYKDDFALVRRIDDAAGFKHELPSDEPAEQDVQPDAAQETPEATTAS